MNSSSGYGYHKIYQINQKGGMTWSNRSSWCINTGLIPIDSMERGLLSGWIGLSDLGTDILVREIKMDLTSVRRDNQYIYGFVRGGQVWLLHTQVKPLGFKCEGKQDLTLSFQYGQIDYLSKIRKSGILINKDIQRNLVWLLTGSEPDFEL